ncbi:MULTISPECIES: class I SAM-dependent methyltransferase [unclassified Methylobacterium]|uniref:class I SAM-dependent methyltransferase n=1 Tax=unclassified Methylobacterium TaxID=2615210 RepID=UPI0011C1E8BA|nr:MULTISPECIES: class I SAM-dependent methyltransferase [unclassified Methylobacterium]QEE39040.1 class I SAM-dependent methyltransferase [Methylobacterium sp. WL1]TXN56753.1 class I SAM-dependent methyltransferase [Methylobacterium sp. WL2]
MTTKFETRIAAMSNAFDIFHGQWCSNVPLYGGGPAALFNDSRIVDFDKTIGGFAGKKVLELGPLEAGHTYCMSLLGASEILAIEANQDAFLRCLVVKEIFDLKAKFLCGDFIKYLSLSRPTADVILASGVLYHLEDPLLAIELMTKVADQICIWTHYYDKELIDGNEILAGKFDDPDFQFFNGRKIKYSRQSYKNDLQRTDFAGGVEVHSKWVSLDGLVSAFDALGFSVDILSQQLNHPHGPGVTFVAKRRLST